MKDQRRTGRTTNMLRYAIQRARNDMPTIIVGADSNHAQRLLTTLRQSQTERDLKRFVPGDKSICAISLTDALSAKYSLSGYNYSTNRFDRTPPDVEVLFDHYALETHLAGIIKYLNASEYIVGHDLWLINTARMLSVNADINIVVEDGVVQYFTEKLEGYPRVTVMRFSELDVRHTMPFSKGERVQTLFQPSALHKAFKGALSQIWRFE